MALEKNKTDTSLSYKGVFFCNKMIQIFVERVRLDEFNRG